MTAPATDLRFALVLLMPLLTLWGLWRDGPWSVVGTLVIWWGLALVDALWPHADRSPPPAGERAWAGLLHAFIRLYVPLQLLLMIAGGVLVWQGHPWGLLAAALMGFSVGFVCGAQGITLAHELGHRRSRIDRALGWVLMTVVAYGHFMVEHYRGHHVRVATADDPASARPGESLYAFLPRTLWGSWLSAWRLEAARLALFKRGWLQSPLLWSTLGSVALLLLPVLMYAITGQGDAAARLAVYLLVVCAVAVLLLETVNYIEHYGLQRQRASGAGVEAFGAGHAWNADHVASNALLINLQRHSDHHLHASKPFEQLQDLPAPRLPTGYAGSIVLAAIPPLWFALMNPRIEAWKTLRASEAARAS